MENSLECSWPAGSTGPDQYEQARAMQLVQPSPSVLYQAETNYAIVKENYILAEQDKLPGGRRVLQLSADQNLRECREAPVLAEEQLPSPNPVASWSSHGSRCNQGRCVACTKAIWPRSPMAMIWPEIPPDLVSIPRKSY